MLAMSPGPSPQGEGSGDAPLFEHVHNIPGIRKIMMNTYRKLGILTVHVRFTQVSEIVTASLGILLFAKALFLL